MATSFGRFSGDVLTRWLLDGRNMQLLERFVYVDPKGKEWVAHKGSIVNGASIPGSLWSTVGGPYEGQYRNASVVHDVACEERTSKWEDVHNMFYEACRCGGVSWGQAKTMYYAVYNFGPRWQVSTPGGAPLAAFGTGVPGLGAASFSSKPVAVNPQDLRAVMDYIQKNNPSLAELRQLTLQQARGSVTSIGGGVTKKTPKAKPSKKAPPKGTKKAPKKTKKQPKG